MTGVIVFSGPSATQIVADTLGTVDTTYATDNRKRPQELRLSSGIVQLPHDMEGAEFHDGFLKIARISDSLAIGVSGEWDKRCGWIMSVTHDRNLKEPFSSIEVVVDFFEHSLFPSCTPAEDYFGLVGMLACEGTTHKFKAEYAPGKGHLIDHSTDQDVSYSIGSGSTELDGIWKNRNRMYLDFLPNPGKEFLVFVEQLYCRQFFEGLNYVKKHKMGGSVTGLFTTGGKIHWHAPRTVILLSNVGGAGLEAEWEYSGHFYKIWEEKDSHYVLTVFERDIVETRSEAGNTSIYSSYSIFSLSNALSTEIPFEKLIASEQANSVNSAITVAILLPKAPLTTNVAAIGGHWDTKPFELISDEDGNPGFRYMHRFSEHLLNECYVADDFTIVKGKACIDLIHDAFKSKLRQCDPKADPREWMRLAAKLAVQKWRKAAYITKPEVAVWMIRDCLLYWALAYDKAKEIEDEASQNGIAEQVAWVLGDLKKHTGKLGFELALSGGMLRKLKTIPSLDADLFVWQGSDLN